MKRRPRGFTLVEVVLAIGIVSFAVLATFGLLSVANDTNRRSRDDQFSTQLVANEFQRLRSLSSANFPNTYGTRYYDSSLTDVTPNPAGSPPSTAVYELQMTITPNASPAPAPPYPPATELIFNAEVDYPATAPAANQSIVRFTTLMLQPSS